MDSKIKRLTILAMLGIMVLVAAIIVVFNYERFVSTGSTAKRSLIMKKIHMRKQWKMEHRPRVIQM